MLMHAKKSTFNPAHLLPLPPELLAAFAGLSGPTETFGTCLSAFEAGDLIWWDEREPPRSGDYVMIEMHPDRQAAWEKKTGVKHGGPSRAIKRLEQRDGEWMLFADDVPDGLPLSDHRILGPVVFRLQPVRKRGMRGTLARVQGWHGELRREIHYIEQNARTPSQREEARLQRIELAKINAKDDELKHAVENEQPVLPGWQKPQRTFARDERKVGRNELCPCGSGKKFKHCHGALRDMRAHCNSLRFGPTTNLAVTDTSQIGDHAATETLEVTVSSLSVVDNSGPPYTDFVTVATLSVPAYVWATTQIVTVNGGADMTNNGATLTSHQVTMGDGGSNFIPNQFVLSNQVVNQGTLRGPFSFELQIAVPANTAKTYTVQARVIGDSAGTITGNVNNVRLKCESIKK